MINHKQIAEEWFSIGVTLIPANAEKRPLMNAGWKERVVGPMAFVAPEWGKEGLFGFHAFCGRASRGLTILDFDLKNAHGEDVFSDFMEVVKSDNKQLYNFLPYYRTKSGGYKIPFFCHEAPKTEALAMAEHNPKPKPIIEIQGEEALSIVPPAEGYKWVKGSLFEIPLLKQEEIDYLIGIARCFDEVEREEVIEYIPKGVKSDSDSPLTRFDNDTNYLEWMQSMGWKVAKAAPAAIHLTRPGAKHKRGVDATIYKSRNLLKIHSTSQDLVPDIDRAYRPYQLLVFMKYKGDFSEAARELAVQYNMTANPPKQGSIAVSKPILPVKNQEHRIVPNNPAIQLKEQIAQRQLETWFQDKNRKGVALTEELIEDAALRFDQIDKEGIAHFAFKYYQEHQDEHDEENIEKSLSQYEKFVKFMEKNYKIVRNTVLMKTEIRDLDNNILNYNIDTVWNKTKKARIKVSLQDVKSFFNDTDQAIEYDPFKEYFTALPRVEAGHIEKLSSYVVVEDECLKFWKSMFRKAIIRTVAGAIGGYINRECIVLCSPKERLGKTSFVRFLCPFFNHLGVPKYYSDESLVMNKEQMFRIAQNLIYLMDELSRFVIKDTTHEYIKMMISKGVVNERPVYDVGNVEIPRRVTFWGTANNPYLMDGENSRFISIPVVKIGHDYGNYKTGTSEVDINKVWAEAYHAYMDGEEFELTEEEREMQDYFNNKWTVSSEAQGLVEAYVSKHSEAWIPVEQIINELSTINPSITRRITTKNLKEALRKMEVPYKRMVNESGYKIDAFRCRVVVQAIKKEEVEL